MNKLNLFESVQLTHSSAMAMGTFSLFH